MPSTNSVQVGDVGEHVVRDDHVGAAALGHAAGRRASASKNSAQRRHAAFAGGLGRR